MAKRKQKSVKQPTKSPISWRKYWPFIPSILAVLLYLNTLGHGFVQDDAIVINDNMFTTQGISGIPGLWKYDTFYGFFKEAGKAALVSGGRYRPLTPTQFAIEYSLFSGQPFGFHLLNVLWFALLVFVVYRVIELLMRNYQPENPQYASTMAFMSAILFAVHPIHTEVVANIKGRDEIMALLLSLVALWMSCQIRKSYAYQWLGGLIFFLGLTAKENTITFLAVMPLAWYVFNIGKWSVAQYLKRLAPYLIAAIAFIGLRSWVLGDAAFTSNPPMELMNNPFIQYVNGSWVPFSLADKFATIFYTLGCYIKLLFIPFPLTHDYYPRHIEMMTWASPAVILSLLAYLGIKYLAVKGSLRHTWWGFALAFYLITLTIVSNIIFPIGTNMGERFMFMPSLGICLFISGLILQLTDRSKGFAPKARLEMWPTQRRNALIGLTFLSIVLGSLTILRNPVWESNHRLFLTDIKVSKRSAKLNNAVGGELVNEAKDLPQGGQRTRLLQRAVKHLNTALEIHPTYKNAYLILGNAYNYLGNYDNSITAYRNALKLSSNDYPDATKNLAVTLRMAGHDIGQKTGNATLALQYLKESYELNPSDGETVRLLGVANGVAGNLEEAIKYLSQASEMQPENADLLFDLGSTYLSVGQADKGNALHQKALQMNPKLLEERQQNANSSH